MTQRMLVPELDGRPLSRQPRRKARSGTPKFQASVVMPTEVGRALRETARSQDRSLSDLVTEACTYWLDINFPDWQGPEVADGGG